MASKKKGESENKKEECMEGPLEDELTNLPLLPSKHSICSANTSITSPSKLEVSTLAEPCSIGSIFKVLLLKVALLKEPLFKAPRFEEPLLKVPMRKVPLLKV